MDEQTKKKWELPVEGVVILALAALTVIAGVGMDFILMASIAGVSFFAGRRSTRS